MGNIIIVFIGLLAGVFIFNYISFIEAREQSELNALLKQREAVLEVLATLRKESPTNMLIFWQSSDTTKEEMISEYEIRLKTLEETILKKFKIYFTSH